MGPRQFVDDVTFGMSIFSHINCDIIGHFYYATGKITRRNQAHKVWVLAIICLYSKALSLVLMADYSSTSFKAAMAQHMYRYGSPSILTADNGSQIRKSGRRQRYVANTERVPLIARTHGGHHPPAFRDGGLHI